MAEPNPEPVPVDTPVDTINVHQEGKPNPTQNVYETVKGVWTWGKDVPVVGFFEGVTECVVNKVVGVAGTSLPEIDGAVKPQLAGLDNAFLNPAIDAVVGTVVAGADKGKEIVSPAVDTVLGVVGMSSEIEDSKKEETFAPEVSKPVSVN